jgi:hypothetical protein
MQRASRLLRFRRRASRRPERRPRLPEPAHRASALGFLPRATTLRAYVAALKLEGPRTKTCSWSTWCQVVFDLGKHPNAKVRVNHGSPRTLTVDAGLLDRRGACIRQGVGRRLRNDLQESSIAEATTQRDTRGRLSRIGSLSLAEIPDRRRTAKAVRSTRKAPSEPPRTATRARLFGAVPARRPATTSVR